MRKRGPSLIGHLVCHPIGSSADDLDDCILLSQDITRGVVACDSCHIIGSLSDKHEFQSNYGIHHTFYVFCAWKEALAEVVFNAVSPIST